MRSPPLALQIYVKIHDTCVISPPQALQIYVEIRDKCLISPLLALQIFVKIRDKCVISLPQALQIYVKIRDKCVISPPLALQIYVKIRDNCVISPPLAFQNTCLIVANALTRQIYVFSRRKRVRRKRRPLSQFSDVVPPKGPNMRRHVHSLCGRNDDPCRNSEPSGSPRAQKSVDVHFPRQKPCKLSKSSMR